MVEVKLDESQGDGWEKEEKLADYQKRPLPSSGVGHIEPRWFIGLWGRRQGLIARPGTLEAPRGGRPSPPHYLQDRRLEGPATDREKTDSGSTLAHKYIHL